MLNDLIYFFFKNYNYLVKSMDYKFFSNIFTVLDIYQPRLDIFGWSLHEFIDFIILQLHFLITAVVLLYIFLSLLWNMFGYSIWYYYLNLIFNIQLLPLTIEEWFQPRTIIALELLNKKSFLKPKILPYCIADVLASICLSLYVLIFINIILYYNLLFLSTPTTCVSFVFEYTLQKWISYSFDTINFALIVDHLSLLMLVVVLTISALVHYYSIDYMSTDPWLLTFLKYLSGFTLAMVVLVTANNLALLFIGWEGVGIFSYLLIGFWYTRTLALKASLKAVIVNRIGDAALVLASALALHYFGTIEFKKLQIIALYLFDFKIENFVINFNFFTIPVVTVIALFLLIAAIGKSAQFGLHTWLPDAMEGPTPVSALIHAATMVTAGVYLVVRLSFFFEISDVIRNATLIVGSFTALFGSLTACFQYDIKRIIAFSTCSQLGYMFLACGLSAYNLAMFHLFIHAFFKALLFLCAGSVIHSIGDEQDIWKMAGLLPYLPITYAGLCIGFFSLAGLPFTSGFFSKDTIIELALTKRTIPGSYAYICASAGAWCTAFYSFRFFYHVIFNDTELPRTVLLKVNEHGRNILTVIFLLTIITIFIGGFTKNPLTSPFSFIFFNDSIFVNEHNFYFNFYESFIKLYRKLHNYSVNYLKWILLLSPFLAIYVSIVVYWYVDYYNGYDLIWEFAVAEYKNSFTDSKTLFQEISFFDLTTSYVAHQRFFETKGSFDQIYNQWIVKPILNFSYLISYKELDKGWLELFFIKLPTFGIFFLAKIFNQHFGSLKLNFLPGIFFMLTVLAYVFFLILN